MLKKAGIVVATATAGLLAVSPLAFAGDYGDDDHDGDHGDDRDSSSFCEQDNEASNDVEGEDGGLISVSNNNVQVPIQACGNDILSGAVGILSFDEISNESNESSDD